MSELKIVATIVARPESLADVLKTLRVLTDASRKEEGNNHYILHQDIANPSRITILESWKSQAAIDFHNQTPHFLALGAQLEGKVESVEVSVIREVY